MKQLADMTLEELWELFPIILKDHNPLYFDWYEEEKENIVGCIGVSNIFRVNHIGSSAVTGLIAKPTVDILIEVNHGSNIHEITKKLKSGGWTLMSEEYNPQLNLIFNKGYTAEGFAEKVFHLHLRYPGDWNELYFRDYLRKYPEVAEEYGRLKLDLWKQFEHNRDGYTQTKTEFILKYTEAAKQEYPNRYYVS